MRTLSSAARIAASLTSDEALGDERWHRGGDHCNGDAAVS
jgi:hypothetical protein